MFIHISFCQYVPEEGGHLRNNGNFNSPNGFAFYIHIHTHVYILHVCISIRKMYKAVFT